MITVVSWFNYYRGFKCKVCPLGEKNLLMYGDGLLVLVGYFQQGMACM